MNYNVRTKHCFKKYSINPGLSLYLSYSATSIRFKLTVTFSKKYPGLGGSMKPFLQNNTKQNPLRFYCFFPVYNSIKWVDTPVSFLWLFKFFIYSFHKYECQFFTKIGMYNTKVIPDRVPAVKRFLVQTELSSLIQPHNKPLAALCSICSVLHWLWHDNKLPAITGGGPQTAWQEEEWGQMVHSWSFRTITALSGLELESCHDTAWKGFQVTEPLTSSE